MNRFTEFLVHICINFLLKKDISVVIGCKIDGDVQASRTHTAIYNTTFNGKFHLQSGEIFPIPKGKFRVERSGESHDN